MDSKIQIFTLGGSDRERRTINTVIQQSLNEKGYANVTMRDTEGQPEAPVENVPNVLQAMAEYDPSLLKKEINVWSIPCSITTADQATNVFEHATDNFKNEGGTLAIGGSGADDEGEFSLTAVFVLQEGPKIQRERKASEERAKALAKEALERTDRAVRRQNIGLHIVQPQIEDKPNDGKE